jgi:serine/threonine-protein kinase
MALRPEPERRYASAEALAADLQRWLDGRPLHATPDSLAYRLRKLARRHRAGVAAAALAVAGLLAGTSLALWQAAEARQESRRARAAAAEASRQARRAEEVTRFLVESFGAADPRRAGGREVTAGEIVDQGVRRIERELRGAPRVRHQLLSALGQITYRLGELERAERLLGEALAFPGASAADRVRDLRYAAMTASVAGDYELAERRFVEALALADRAGIDRVQRTEVELELAMHLGNVDQYERAEERLRGLLASAPSRPLDVQRARAAITLAHVLVSRGQFAEAHEWGTRSVADLARSLGTRHLEVADARSILANIEAILGRLEAAEALERQALATFAEAYGPRHHRTLQSQNDLATYLKNRGRFAESGALLETVLVAQEAALGADHPHVAVTCFNLGEARLLAGDVEGALAAYRRATEIADANPSGLAARRGVFHALYGRALGRAGEARRAEAKLLRGLELLAAAPGPDHPVTARVAVEYAAFLNDAGRRDEARRRVAGTLPVLEAAYGEASRELALARLQLGRALWRSDRGAAAELLDGARAALAASPYRGRYGEELELARQLLAGGVE